ncbi:MAG: 16S rRNA (guanine(527)-N(7))-methyltransferase RsmG [Lachnospiraceae bacterium]|nr:16S rRNA (guanine(527)-N(7))-methyltransferase RsmG [Lachnospiraceae bacterium]
MNNSKDLFLNCLDELGLKATDEQINQFYKFYELLIEKNKVMNLTSITEIQDVIIKHFVDSLSIVKIMDLNSIDTLIDVGTGAGFPGVPIKIMFPDIKVVLMDSLNKRINFLKESCEQIGLHNIYFVHGRAEELGRNVQYREQFDICVSRAVANLSTLSEYCLPFVKVGGSFICYKSGDSNEEINAAKNAIDKLSGNIDDRVDFNLPNSDFSRTLLKIDKISKMSKKYPRKAGTPSKEPLQ